MSPTTHSVNLSKPEITNALLNKLNAANLARLRTTSKAMKTAIDSRKNLRAKITKLGQRQEQIRTLLGRHRNANFNQIRMKHKNFRLGKIVAKYFQGYNLRGKFPNFSEVAVYKMPAGQLVNFPMKSKPTHTRIYNKLLFSRADYKKAQNMKRDKKTNLRKNGNLIYFRTANYRHGTFTFNKRRSQVRYIPNSPEEGGGSRGYHYGVKLSNIFSKSNRRKIKAL